MTIRMYEGLPSDLRRVVDDAWKSFSADIKLEGYGIDNSDAAEKLIDAMTEYFLASNPSFRTVVRNAAIHYDTTGEYTKGCGP